MAKITAPLMSKSASGSIGKEMTFSERKSGSQVRYQKKQKTDEPTQAQVSNQSLYRVIYARWLSMSAGERSVFNDEVKTKNLQMSGWNLFLKKAMSNPDEYLGLKGYWTFNDDTAEVSADISKNGFPATLKPTYPGDVPVYVDSKNSKMKKALKFDGVNDCASVPYGVLDMDGFSPYTFACWFKPTVLSGLRSLFANFKDAPPRGILLARLFTSNRFYVIMTYRDTINVIQAYFDFPAPNYNEWNFVAYTYSGSGTFAGINVYLNGELTTPTMQRDNLVTSLSHNTNKCIGNSPNNVYSENGSIDEPLLYGSELSQSEVRNLYNLFK